MTLSWAPVYGTPELNCSLMKDFIPLYRLLWAGSQCSVPFSTSLNGFCWIFIHFCSFGCKCLGKWLHFFQCLQSFPSKSWSHHEASEVYLLFSKEGRKVSMWSNLLAAPGILHLWKAQRNVREAEGWETPLVTIFSALCLEEWLTCSLLGSPGFLHLKKSTNGMKAQVLFAGEFYFCPRFMQSIVASASCSKLTLVFSRINPSSHGLWGELKALPSPRGLVGSGWILLVWSLAELGNGAVFWEGAIKCQGQ